MLMPLAATLITRAFNREPLLGGLGVSWRVNVWWLVAWLAPIAIVAAMLVVAGLMPGCHVTTCSQLLTSILKQVNDALPAGLKLSPLVFVGSQVVNGLIGGATINAALAFGEEIGWRGYLLKQFEGMNFLLTSVIIGAIWGVWHAPLILMGHNFPTHRVIGVAVMVVFCVCLSPVVQYIRVKSGSVIAAAVFHGSFNAFATFVPLFINEPDDLIAGPAGLVGIATLALIVAVMYCVDRRQFSAAV